jgi:hypothetical protein
MLKTIPQTYGHCYGLFDYKARALSFMFSSRSAVCGFLILAQDNGFVGHPAVIPNRFISGSRPSSKRREDMNMA